MMVKCGVDLAEQRQCSSECPLNAHIAEVSLIGVSVSRVLAGFNVRVVPIRDPQERLVQLSGSILSTILMREAFKYYYICTSLASNASLMMFILSDIYGMSDPKGRGGGAVIIRNLLVIV